MRIVLIALVCTAGLAGCAATYKPDLDGSPAATLRIASLHPAESRVAVLGGDCVPFARSEWDEKTRRIAVLKDANGVLQKVPAGQPLTLSFFTSTTRVEGKLATDEVCAVAMRFTPQAGAEYDAIFTGDSEACRMELGRTRPQAASGPRTEPVADAKEVPGCN